MEKISIVAIADNYAIGKDNQLLWHISDDLKYFKKVTLSFPVIMGYKTYLSIGRPLPNRKNIVISKFPWEDAPKELSVVRSLEEAFRLVEDEGTEKCFIIGGGATYKEAMPLVDKLYITNVHTTITDADTFFPEIDKSIWKEIWTSELHKDEKSGYKFEFKIYNRF